MSQIQPTRSGRLAASTGALLLACILAMAGGCDGEGADGDAMVMNRGTAPEGQPATRPARDPEIEVPETEEELPPAPVYISIDGVPYEFPPAKLWLKRTGNRVRAQLFSDDPPEALDRDWSGDSFYFEMDMELPREVYEDAAASGVEGEVTAEQLASAEWIFQSPGSQRADTRSGIFLGAASHLQPITVSVMFDPLDEETVMVTLEGLFAEFDQSRPHDTVPKRQVRVQAALSADAIRR